MVFNAKQKFILNFKQKKRLTLSGSRFFIYLAMEKPD